MASTTHLLRIEVHDLAGRANGLHLQASLAVDGTRLETKPILSTGLWNKLFADITWYLDEYIYSDAFAVERASLVERDLRDSCRRLAVDLELDRILSQTTSPFDHVEIQIVNSAQSLYELAFDFPWELLEHTDFWSSSTRSVTVSRLISNDSQEDTSTIHPGSAKINILLVLARAPDTLDGRPRDIPPFVALEAITQLSDRLAGDGQLNIEVARPGTWSSVKECLASHPPGYYSLVHFDVHGGTRAQAPSLSFADPYGLSRLKKEFVTTVARSLKKANVHNVVLNACGSASNAQGADANPAHIFLQHGITNVVGMSHRASAEAMSLFLKVFYEKLVESASFSAATATGRRVLSDARSRSTNQQVDRDLSDYILPILYTSRESAVSLTATSMEVDDPPELAPTVKGSYLEGRDFDVLQLENSVRTSELLCMVGIAGMGKSTLLHRAAEVWKQTGFVASYLYVDLADQNIATLEDFLRATQSSNNPKNLLIIIDNIQNALKLTSVENKRVLPKAEWERIQNHVAEQHDSKYIIVARNQSIFNRNILAKANVFTLEGLHPLDSLTLLRREIGSSAAQWSPEDRSSADLLLEMLQHSPLAIQLVVPWISSSDLGIHDFLEALLDWKLESEFSTYWQALAKAQAHLPVFADITRCYLKMDRCGQFMWLWIALYWNHGSQVSSTSTMIGHMSPDVQNRAASTAHALELGEEHGLFITSDEPRFIRCINPIFTIWMRFGLFHGLRVLRNDQSEYTGDTFHAFMATGNLRSMFEAGNPIRVDNSGRFFSALPAKQQEAITDSQGHLKAFWTGDFSDALVHFKDSTDEQYKISRTREMRFNFLAAFNTLMGSQVVLDHQRMQLFELRLFWMMARPISGPHETLMQTRRIVGLMKHLMSKIDISELEEFRIEAALGLLGLPIQKAACTLEGTSAIHKEMLGLAKDIWKACEARFGDNMPHLIAVHGPLLQLVSRNMGYSDDSGSKISFEELKSVTTNAFSHLGKSNLGPNLASEAQKKADEFLDWIERFAAEASEPKVDMEDARKHFEKIRPINSVAFDNPMDPFAQALANEKDQAKWSDHLADALQNGDPVRAVRLLKPMITDSLGANELDKALKLLDMFWELRARHPSLSKSELQEFVDLDARVRFDYELEQFYRLDAPPDGVRAAYIRLKEVHSLFIGIADGTATEEQKQAAAYLEKIWPVFVPEVDPGTTEGYMQAGKFIFEAAQKETWAQDVVTKHMPILKSMEKYESANREAQELSGQGDFVGARERLRDATSSYLDFNLLKEQALANQYKVSDIPQSVAVKKAQLETLTAYGIGAFGKALMNLQSHNGTLVLQEIEVALGIFEEAAQISEELSGLSLSEQPLGLNAEIRQARSYFLETQILVDVMKGELGTALQKCNHLVNLLTAFDPHLSTSQPEKVAWYRDVRARLGAYHHARQWRRLTDSFKPHQATLQLKRIAHFFGQMDNNGPSEDGQAFFSIGITMSMTTCKQLTILKTLGPKVGSKIWQLCRASMDVARDDLCETFDVLTVFYYHGLLELVARDVD